MPWQALPLSYAIAIYPFQPSASPAELPLQVGDQLYVIEQGGKDGAWCRGYLMAPPSLLSALNSTGKQADARVFSGIFPKSCIEIREELGDDASTRAVISQEGAKPPAPVPMLKVGDESPSSSTEPLVDEISSCLREWYISHLPDLVLRRDYTILDHMSTITTRLDYSRRALLNDVLTAQERAEVQEEAVWDLVRGNKMLGAETIVRDPKQQGRLLTGEDSAIEVTKLQSIMSLLDEAPSERLQEIRLHHCLLEIKSIDGSDLDTASITVMLYQKQSDGSFRQFSESCTALAAGKLKTLLADLSMKDVTEDGSMYLVLKVTVTQQPKPVPKEVTDQSTITATSVTTNGTSRARSSLSDRKRTSLLFGSKRKTDRPLFGLNGRSTAQSSHRSVTPSIPEEPADDESIVPRPQVHPVPRTIGVGIVDIAPCIRSETLNSVEVEIRSPAVEDEELAESGSEFLQQLLPSPTGHYTNCDRISKIDIDLTPYQAHDADVLIKTTPTSMHQVSKTQKVGFSEAAIKPRSDIYLILSRAEVFKGSHLSHPELGTVPIRSTALPNLQLTMELRDGSGKRVEHSIFTASNSAGVTALRTNAVEAGQSWDQLICIRIPYHKVMETHMVLSVADAPEFPFALAWMPLWDKQTFMSDGKHSLVLHAYDKTTSTFSSNGQGAYLSLPWDRKRLGDYAGHDGIGALVASLEVETRLCSTEFSQDSVLASLFNWRALTSPRLMEMLQKLFFVPEIEIVKQLNQVLDALFTILGHKTGSAKFEDTIFNNIVFVLGIVHDRRFNLGPLVEKYADEHFKAPPIATALIRSWTRLLQSVSDPQSSREMRALFKVGKQFLKLLVRSCSIRQSDDEQDEAKTQSIKADLQAIIFGLQMLMRSETAALVGNKTILVQNFHSWLPELLPVFSADETLKFAINFVDSCEEVTGKLVMYKLVLIQNYTKMPRIWDDPKDWRTLVRHCLRWLNTYWSKTQVKTDEWREQIRLCCAIVAELATRPIPLVRDFLPLVISTYCALCSETIPKKRSLSLLFPTNYPFTVKPIQEEEYFSEALLELAALLPTLSRIELSQSNRKTNLQSASNILETLNMTKSLFSDKVFPSSWLSLQIHHHYTAIDILTAISNQMTTFFLPEPEHAEAFNMELWKLFLETILLLVASPALTLESFSEQKRRAVWKIAGDVRQAGANLLRHCWGTLGWEATADDERRYGVQRLGGYQVQYVPALVGPIIELCLGMHEGLRRVAVEILQAMIISEWGLNEDLVLIETEVVGALNSLLKPKDQPLAGSGNEAHARKLFVGELLELFGTIANQPDDALWTALEDLVATIEELIDLLSSGEEADIDEHYRHETRPGTVNGRHSSDIPDRSISRLEGKTYGKEALEVYKQLAEDYERNGDYKRLARTHRAIARIHEARATNHISEDLNGGASLVGLDEEDEGGVP